MSASTLEERVARVEETLAEMQKQLSARQATLGILSIAGTMSDYPEFDELTAHGKYLRKTGQLPPRDWKPGDPIPEPDE